MFLKLIAYLVSRPRAADWLIRRAMKTPYTHLTGYMNRYWLFNPYSQLPEGGYKVRWPRLRWSIRIHHILREDVAGDPHDHPWNARSFILKEWYVEQRENVLYVRLPGDTVQLRFGVDFHRIDHVAPGGCWTLFITDRFEGDWGFLENGVKVPHKQYLAAHPNRAA